MKVSFVIPAYNSEKTLSQCLQSVLKQKFAHDFEVIVVDNASTDNTAKIIKSFDKVVYHFESEPGRSQARNSGAKKAQGEYLAFIDSDVTLEESWLEIMFKHASGNIVGIQGIIKPLPSKISKFLDDYRDFLFQERRDIGFNLLKMRVIESPMINTASCVYRRAEFLSIGGFDDSLKRHEDIDLAKRLFLNGYHLQCTQALSYVYFDQNLWDYLKRSFEEGVTKVSYVKKWSNFNYTNIPSNLRVQFHIFVHSTIMTFINSLLSKNPYLLFMGTNALLRSVGRAYGGLRKDLREPLMITTKDSLIYDNDKIIIKYDSQNTSLEEV